MKKRIIMFIGLSVSFAPMALGAESQRGTFRPEDRVVFRQNGEMIGDHLYAAESKQCVLMQKHLPGRDSDLRPVTSAPAKKPGSAR